MSQKMRGQSSRELREHIEQQIQNSLQINMTMFQKLSVYDSVIGSNQISRVHPIALDLFKKIIEEDMAEAQDESVELQRLVYRSPPNMKTKFKDDVEDPELFSFSKTRKQTSNQAAHLKTVHPAPAVETNFRNLFKYNSDRVQMGQKSKGANRDISQFREDEKETVAEMVKENSSNLHQACNQLKSRIVHKNFAIFCSIMRTSLSRRRQNLKMKTSQFMHQMSLMKKSLEGLMLNYRSQKLIVTAAAKKRRNATMGRYFQEWKMYAMRSEEQKLREREIKTKKKQLMRMLGLNTFIANAIGRPRKQEVDEAILRDKSKLEQVQKMIGISRWKNFVDVKKESMRKYGEVHKHLQISEYRTFQKLLTCYHQRVCIKLETLEKRVRLQVSRVRFIYKMKQEFHFQKAYWSDAGRNLGLPVESQAENIHTLDPKYQKIVFIYEIFDCIEHSLKRKGYSNDEQSLLAITQTHPAYKQYFRPYKLQQYFSALKQYLTGIRLKEKQIKFEIVGQRVLGGMLCWYRDWIQWQLNIQQQNQKQIRLQERQQKRAIKQFFRYFSKKTFFQEKLRKQLQLNRKRAALMTLQSYRISKDHYRSLLFEFRGKKIRRIEEKYFLQWKLVYVKETHFRLLMRDCMRMRKKLAVRAIARNINDYGLLDRIHRKRFDNVCANRFSNYAQTFIGLLVSMKRQVDLTHSNGSYSLEAKRSKLYKVIHDVQRRECLQKMMKNRYFVSLTKSILTQVTREYQIRSKFKIFMALKACRQLRKQQNRKMEKIRQKSRKLKLQSVIQTMVESTLKNMLLRNCTAVMKRYAHRVAWRQLVDVQGA